MKESVQSLASLTMAVSAVAIAGSVLYGQVFQPQSVSSAPDLRLERVEQEEWELLLAGGTRLGTEGAPVQLVEFGDLECPFCATFHEVLTELTAEFEGQIALTYYHFPIGRIHRFAEPAAIAAECAVREHRFSQLIDELMRGQDSLGLKSWAQFAREAGVADTVAFKDCLTSEHPRERLARDKAQADRFGVTATPTVFLNGHRFNRAPDRAALRSHIARILDGQALSASSRER